jgi:hypothetical protein
MPASASTYTSFGVLFFRQYSVFKDPVVLSHQNPRLRTVLKSSGERLHLHEGLLLLFSVCLVGLGRVELPTSPLSGVRSNQLSYRPSVLVELIGIEPTTS